MSKRIGYGFQESMENPIKIYENSHVDLLVIFLVCCYVWTDNVIKLDPVPENSILQRKTVRKSVEIYPF
jgi:hypothetical protein